MVRSPRAKGTDAESRVVQYLNKRGWPGAERRALRGTVDAGDVAGIPGVVVEVKAQAAQTLAAWCDQASKAGKREKADVWVVWHRRRGKGSAGDWYVTTDGETFASLLKAAGH